MLKNNRGMTLVEVMISLLILLIASLALMQTALLSIDSNMTNVLRNEAIDIAAMRMSEARSMDFDSLPLGSDTRTVRRELRGVKDPYDPAQNFPFSATRNVIGLGSGAKQVDVTVTWSWKGLPYVHTESTIVRKL